MLVGGAGIDMLFGGNGADTLNGGAGYDMIDLGADDAMDFVIFNAGDSAASDHIDQVFNFHQGEDRIDLSGFGGLQFAAGGFTGSAPEVLFDGGQMHIDVNGDGAADMVVQFVDGSQLAATDIIF
jgi:Ca2+-binding RTX toxin-like protein